MTLALSQVFISLVRKVNARVLEQGQVYSMVGVGTWEINQLLLTGEMALVANSNEKLLKW